MINQRKINLIVLLCLIVVLVSQIFHLVIIALVSIVLPLPTGTPWIKQDVLIETKSGRGLNVWTDNITIAKRKINEIEGVTNTTLLANGHMIYVAIDPRYDKALVAEEIKNRLINSRTD